MSERNRPCDCGSGRRYKHCCGALGVTSSTRTAAAVPVAPQGPSPYVGVGQFRDDLRGQAMAAFCESEPEGKAPGLAWAPPGLLVVGDFMDADTCTRWREHFDRQQTTPATVKDPKRRNPDGSPVYRLDKQRITEFVPKAELEDEIQRTLQGACRDVIAPYYGRELEWMSYPGVLKYRAGGEYKAHADSEHWDVASKRWVRAMDRDYSMLLYVNGDFEGGSLYFKNFDVRLNPAPGMLVVFPSDHRYLHAAEPITRGERYAIVCWTSALGTPRISPPPPGTTRL
jgi:predicted 2-oxoglutarate/Fe(II)-dependent dioxygenase YbiX